MKKNFILVVAIATCFSMVSQNAKPKANTQNATVYAINELKRDVKMSDSITNESLKAIENQLSALHKDSPRFKMCQTENNHILLKIDTRIGRVWMVQYALKNFDEAMTVSINYYGVVFENEGWNGRFELYPTKNMYNFIMLDTGTGTAYQVQWSTDAVNTFVREIK